MTPPAPFHSTPTTGGRRRGRPITPVAITGVVLALVVLGAAVAVVVARPWDGPDGSPEAVILGTDGTQVIATPVRTDAAKLSDEEIDSAVLLLRERVKAAHAAGVEVSRQGDTDILVAFLDVADQATIDRLLGPVDGAFRPVLVVSGPAPGPTRQTPRTKAWSPAQRTARSSTRWVQSSCPAPRSPTRRPAGRSRPVVPRRANGSSPWSSHPPARRRSATPPPDWRRWTPRWTSSPWSATESSSRRRPFARPSRVVPCRSPAASLRTTPPHSPPT